MDLFVDMEEVRTILQFDVYYTRIVFEFLKLDIKIDFTKLK